MAFNTNASTAPAARKWFTRPGPIIGLALVLVLGFTFIANYIKWGNYGVQQENALAAQLDSNKNNLGQLTLKVREALKLAEINNEDLNDVLRNAIQGRYGENGAQTAVLFVQENYPGVYDPSMFKTVQQTILAGRTDFEAKQNILIDQARVYKNATEFFWSGFWLKVTGHPGKNFNWADYKPVLANDTQQKFDTKVDGGFIDTTPRDRRPQPPAAAPAPAPTQVEAPTPAPATK